MAIKFDFPSFYQGDKVDFSFTKDGSSGLGDFTDYGIKMDIKSIDGNLLLSFADTNNSIIPDPSTLHFVMSSSDFSVLQAGTYRYDLELTDDNEDKLTLLYGAFPVKNDITK